MHDLRILPKISSPDDVKALSEEDILTIASEIRQTIIETAAKNGGHLASNLGMVEATIAMHRVFSCPADAFVFDVGHQCYTHKLLTGRFAEFGTLRTAGGLSGFTNRAESKYDALTAGHSGTSLSAAIGLAEANRLAGRDSWVVAVVGDGSFTNGMIYEALNQLSGKNLRIIIILNDNEMSISRNVGGVSNYLSLIRTSEGYFTFKVITKRIFGSIPFMGRALVSGARKIRDFVKRITNSESLFENLGLEYIGPVNGNDFSRISAVLEEAKKKNCPVIVHIKTKKGLGFAPAEEHPEKYHSTGAFPLDGKSTAERVAKARTFTDEVSDLLCGAAESDSGFCAVTAAMTDGCGLAEFAARFEGRFFDVGIAEEHLVTMAGGLALGGMKPAAVLYSTFSQRVFDQLWHDVSLQGAHVILMLSHCGIVPGDGVTHQGIYDVSLISEIPGAEIYSPDTFAALARSFEAARCGSGLSVVRYPKGGEAKYGAVCFTETESGLWKHTEIGVGDEYDALITYGRISENAVAAAEIFSRKTGHAVRIAVLNRIFPTPLDAELKSLVGSARRVHFVEETYRSGGIGDRFAADCGLSVNLISIEEPFLPHGDLAYLMKSVGMDSEGIASRMA